jgi:predicted metal-binding membrane protein
MTFGLHWVRRRQRDLARVVLALFCLAWLQAAALPCAMADETQPAAGQVAMDAGETGHDCQYCPPPQPATSGDEQPGACAYPHAAQVDARFASGWMIAPPVITALTSFEIRPSVAVVVPQPGALPQRLPFSVSYCRFIE